MTPLALSILFGLGIGLLYDGLTRPARPQRGGQRLQRIREFLIQAGLRDVSPREFLAFSIGSGLALALLAELLLSWPLVSVLAFGLGLGAPFAYYVHRQERRRSVVQDGLTEAVAQLRDMIRTGLSVAEALAALGQHGPEALRPEFAILAREMRLVGFEPALSGMRERLADPVFDTVAAAILLNDRLGGRNISQVLDSLAQATRAQLRVHGELRAYQARNVTSARIVAAVPLVVLIAIRALNPTYLAVFSDFSGQLILAGCVVSVALGYLAMLWVSRLPGEPRVLG
jgi:tight adherence protein B